MKGALLGPTKPIRLKLKRQDKTQEQPNNTTHEETVEAEDLEEEKEDLERVVEDEKRRMEGLW